MLMVLALQPKTKHIITSMLSLVCLVHFFFFSDDNKSNNRTDAVVSNYIETSHNTG